jgi:hypothetical protein
MLREEHRLRVFQNMVLRKIFGPEKEEVRGEWRKFHYEELQDLYFSRNIIRCEGINKTEMGAKCCTYGGEGTYVHTGLWQGNVRKFDHLENLGMDGRIILKRILNK